MDPERGTLDLADLDGLMNRRTRLVAFPHASNVVAAINPVADVVARAAEVGARVVVDGVSYAPHGLPDIGGAGSRRLPLLRLQDVGSAPGGDVRRRDLAGRLGNEGHYFVADQPRFKLVPAGTRPCPGGGVRGGDRLPGRALCPPRWILYDLGGARPGGP